VENVVALRAACFAIRTPAVAATDNGRLAAELAAGIRLRESSSSARGLRARRSEAAALAMGHVHRGMAGGASWKGARPARSEIHSWLRIGDVRFVWI